MIANQTKVPFVDLYRQHESIIDELNYAISSSIDKSAFTLGHEVELFEHEFAKFCNAEFAVGVGSGTDALHFALRACGVEPGDEVVTAVNTFTATAEAIWMCGARPVFVDMDERTHLIDIDKIEKAITKRTKAIIPVHIFGQPVDMDRVMSIAGRYGLKVVEDACQAHGAMQNGKPVGSCSNAACFSFYPGKNLGAMGDGGTVITNNSNLAGKIQSLRNHGKDGKHYVETGFCSRLHALQAAVLRVKLKYLESWNALRIEAAGAYSKALAGSGYALPQVRDNCKHVFHLYVIRAPERDNLVQKLAKRGIGTGVHYPTPLHLEPAFSYLGYKQGDFPVAEKAAREIVSLPMFPFISRTEIEEVVSALKENALSAVK